MIFGVAENIKTMLVNSMKKWRMISCAGNMELGEVAIRQGIFLRNFLSALVFCSRIDFNKFNCETITKK